MQFLSPLSVSFILLEETLFLTPDIKFVVNLLYNMKRERDSCGTGFVTNISGQRSHAILSRAIEAVTNLTHRGGASADGTSGDGAGICTQMPTKLFRKYLQRNGFRIPKENDLAAGVFFFHYADDTIVRTAQRLAEEIFKKHELHFLTWRDVPINQQALGEIALKECPQIKQVLLIRPWGVPVGLDFERKLYLARKEIEKDCAKQFGENIYIPSLSHRTIVYKGLLIAPQLPEFYLDLQNPDYETAIALFHQRYSTNTFPTWRLSQPFRTLAHNGEINTIQGNENWMRARESALASSIWKDHVDKILPVLQKNGSDSAKLDNAAELLMLSGRPILHTMMMLVPEAHENDPHISKDLKAFYDYHDAIMEPWDGPASLVFTDGVTVGATLDRNGLRPARYTLTKDGLVILASETGVLDLTDEEIKEKGKLGPGQILAIDTEKGRLLRNREIKQSFAKKAYREWLQKDVKKVPRRTLTYQARKAKSVEPNLQDRQVAFGYGKEDIERIFYPMVMHSKQPVGSMGDDTPLSVLSDAPRPIYSYFKQKFAQVTNPPIDPIREKMVMSLRIMVGHRGNFLEELETHARHIRFSSPVLSTEKYDWLKKIKEPAFKLKMLASVFKVKAGLSGMLAALGELYDKADKAIDDGASMLVISDRGVNNKYAAIPMLLALSGLHHHLIQSGRRMKVSLICDTGDVRDEHQIACLIGYGATCVHPYLAYETILQLRKVGLFKSIQQERALRNYRKALNLGLLKIMAKMGISTLNSYQGAQIFEAIGLTKAVIDTYFTGTESRIGGVDIADITNNVLQLHANAFPESEALPDYGIYRFRKHGEVHAFNPDMMRPLHKAVRQGRQESAYEIFSDSVNNRPPVTLRDLLDFKYEQAALDLAQVEPAEEIVKRFSTTAMSLGALSPEAHIVLAIAMNRMSAKSNSGEGGENPQRISGIQDIDSLKFLSNDLLPTDSANSAIKQIASARFGVTPRYLQSAQEIEIKMAQGAKPGEGGQLPRHKVTREIAKIRFTVPGTSLISPPPHHDIYSIEDLAQLIYDLKTVNRRARISVKLVSEAGIGTIAAGVAKANADGIHISGHDGGTGASPLSSIKNTGIPWELGLAEAQHVLSMNNLRSRVYLRVDGGLKTGRDVLVAALLGADEFGFGTAALIAIGCVMARQCHLNTCPVGVATQRQELRSRFKGKPDHVIRYFTYVAQEVRQLLAQLGYHSLAEVIGKKELLCAKNKIDVGNNIKLNFLNISPGTSQKHDLKSFSRSEEDRLDDQFLPAIVDKLRGKQEIRIKTEIKNTNRAVGARIAGEITKYFPEQPIKNGTVEMHFRGTAGQSFGAFCVSGMRLIVEGDANDYVGKGMNGGEIIIYPSRKATFKRHENVIVGNTVMYGATGGKVFISGQAGERFCVRNSGGVAIVEGVGDHACEYMTGGIVVVLGSIGKNFGAGMTGGIAYLLDTDSDVLEKCNGKSVAVEKINVRDDDSLLLDLLHEYVTLTSSEIAALVLAKWKYYQKKFKKIRPHTIAVTKRKMPTFDSVMLNSQK